MALSITTPTLPGLSYTFRTAGNRQHAEPDHLRGERPGVPAGEFQGGTGKMSGKFIIAGETQPATLDWGRVGWLSNPSVTGAARLAIVEGHLFPGKGHDFHKHPHQEEVIFLVAGRIEQWIDRNKRSSALGTLPSSRRAWSTLRSMSAMVRPSSLRSSALVSARALR